MHDNDIQRLADALADEQIPLAEIPLDLLSNLTREQQAVLDSRWTQIALPKRRLLLERLAAMAEEDIQFDFRSLFRRALSDPDATVRRLAVDGLWEDESVSLVRPLLALLQDDPSPDVRASAALGLGRFVYQGEMGFLPAERAAEVVNALLACLNDGAAPLDVRRRALEGVAFSSDERVRPLIAHAYEEAAEAMRLSALFAMGRSADDYWSGIVRGELHNPEPAFRFEASRAAGELADRRAAPALIALLADSDQEIREMAVWALGQVGGSAARKALQQVARGDNRAMRRLAKEALAELALLDDEEPRLLLTEEEPDEELWVDDDLEPLFDDEFDEDDEDEGDDAPFWDEAD